jgi:hypothetical protein
VIPTDGSLAWLEAGADAAVIMGARDDGSGGLSPALWRSSDGLVWEKVFGEVVSHAEPFQLVAGPGGFLAAASDGSGVWRSTDGASWDSLGSTIPIDPSGTATSSVYLVPTIPAAAADAFFAITATGATSSRDPDYAQTLWRSTDGRAWSRVVGPEPVLITWLYPGRDGMLLSVSAPSPVTSLARSTPAWWQSVDGRSWTKLDTLRGLDAGFNSWVVSDGTWVYAFSPVTGRLAASLDGLSWQEIPAYAGPGVPSFAYWASFTRVTAGPAGIFGTGGAAIPGSSSPGIWVAAPGAPPPGSQPLGPEIIRDFPCPGGQECGG